MNTYQTGDGLLAFTHIEIPGAPINGTYNPGKGRIGLAWSTDMGSHFTYLGNIIVPHGDPVSTNVEGVPYIVKDGYFYVYYTDSCGAGNPSTAVARAPIADVLNAAKQGTTVPWAKYYQGAWNSPGIGGDCTLIGLDGVSHTDAAYSTYTDKYYIVMSWMNWNNADTYLKLYESSDGISWTYKKTIVDAPASAVREGYQYVTIIDQSGSDNAVVGQKFYVYSGKDPYTYPLVYRWLVDLNGTDAQASAQSSFTASTDYISASNAGGAWGYYYMTDTAVLPMKWAASPWDANTFVWTGGETYALIGKGWMHPGPNEDVLLVWTAPKSGTVNVTGRVAKGNTSCGDGVVASVSHGFTQQWQSKQPWKKEIAFNDSVGSPFALTESVSTGDTIYFTLNKGVGTNDCDATNFDPTITYIQ